MSMRASAARYARALLDVAIKESDPERAEQELAAFVDLVRTNADLQRTLANPVVSAADKRAIVQQILERLQPTTPVGKLRAAARLARPAGAVAGSPRRLPRTADGVSERAARRGDDRRAAVAGACRAAAAASRQRHRPHDHHDDEGRCLDHRRRGRLESAARCTTAAWRRGSPKSAIGSNSDSERRPRRLRQESYGYQSRRNLQDHSRPNRQPRGRGRRRRSRQRDLAR